MRVALIEWTQGGHHEIYLKVAATALCDAGHEVWIFHPEPDQICDEILAERPELSECLKPAVLSPQGRLVRNRDPRLHIAGKWLSVRRALGVLEGMLEFDLVFFMFLDEFLAPLISTVWLDSAFRYPWAGLIMQPLFRLQDTKLGRRPEFLRRDHLLRSVRFAGGVALDEGAVPWLRERFDRPFEPVPDFGDFAAPDGQDPMVRELVAFANGRPIVGAFGSLAKRKGILNLLRAAPLLAPSDCVFAIAGVVARATFTPQELAEIDMATSALGDRCWFRPAPIPTDAAFSGLISVASVVYIAYEEWVFSSGLQSVAGYCGVPVIVADNGVMADRATTYQIGLTINPTSPEEAATAIRKLLAEPPPPERYADFNAGHQTEAFRSGLCAFVEKLQKA
ncbi:MAG: glycosyltransferase [Fimbriimonadaceae bacterium]